MRSASLHILISLLCITSVGCSSTPDKDMTSKAVLTVAISKPQVDVPHLRSVVIEQPTFSLALDRTSTASSKQRPTTAVICVTGSANDCKQTTIISTVRAQLGPNNRITGTWQITHGTNVMADYGITTENRITITQPDEPHTSDSEQIPFSLIVGETKVLKGLYGMTMTAQSSR